MQIQVHRTTRAGLGRSPALPVALWRSPPTCNAVMGFDGVASAIENAKHSIQEEVVIEGTLHITAVQAGSCMQRYSLDPLTAPQAANEDVAEHWQPSEDETAEAICLATPMEPTEEDINGRSLQSLESNRSSVGRIAAQLEIVQEEIAWRRRSALMLTAECVEASYQVHRRRRAALLKAVRASRVGLRALMAAPHKVLSSLQSWDGEDA